MQQFAPFLSGFFLALSLIVAIGAQNAFILRQGLLRQHVFVLCLICALSDAVLISAGVAGLGTLVSSSPMLIKVVTLGGSAFLFAYAALAFYRAWRPQTMSAAGNGKTSLKAAIAACLAFTFLNPHVYLDTVVLLGSLSAQFEGVGRLQYALGAILAATIWFFGLGYGARLLEPIFSRPAAWRVLDILIGLVMTAIGISLLSGLGL